MKTFLEYLTQTQKTYDFKVKTANIDPKDHLDEIKTALAGYAVETVGAVKSLPIMENCIDFPNIKNAEIHVFEVELKYPVQATQLREMIAETIGATLNQVYCVPSNHPEELWRNKEGELREYVQGEEVLTKDGKKYVRSKFGGYTFAEAIGTEPSKLSNTYTKQLPAGTPSPVTEENPLW